MSQPLEPPVSVDGYSSLPKEIESQLSDQLSPILPAVLPKMLKMFESISLTPVASSYGPYGVPT